MKTISYFQKILLGLVLSIFFIIPSLAVQANTLESIKKNKELRHLGIPYANFVTGTGDGLDVDLMKLFASHLGVKYVYVQTDWKNVISDLTGKKVKPQGDDIHILGAAPIKGDVIANGLTKLPWRKKVLNFSDPTFPTQVWLLARAHSSIKPINPTGNIKHDILATKNLLKGKTILDKQGTCLDGCLYNLSQEGVQLKHFQGGLNDMAPAIINGDAELTLLDVPDALVALAKWPQKLKVIGPLSQKQVMGVGFAQNSPALLKAFNNFLRQLKSSGKYHEMVRKYYPSVFAFYPEFLK
ncbi:transporter substrate-binding domain-containing protein [Dethiosulfatarculus sandiegensis]|uniref:ABC transporter substrate-binding protein n=1 Tax=Dethiosulfatarculus sandiegensis TaxID=1429043 RepID=A0A0D2GDM2_9BACT|nr:transporter substrate-binding domain-containing protein [Dethiosulfatarculus sandiegensis]KIX13017.1 ABC transporter substrate-binding protein [Dethiosulfatarculus sandiegensis]